jgi:catechol 2,3-dioxygenase-like lactoylglutathione lyase family enzyme
MASAPDVKLTKIGIIMLGVKEMKSSLAFYRDVLGLSIKFPGPEFAFLDAGGVTLCLRSAPGLKDSNDERRTEVVFQVEDIQAAHDALKARGVAFRQEPRIVTGDQLAADFRDPDGHVLSIFGPRAKR